MHTPEIHNPNTFLGVRTSCTNRQWLGLTPEQDKRSMRLKQLCKIEDIIARSLARMNLEPEEVEVFLNPMLKNAMFDPSDLLDMDKAAHRIYRGIMAGEKFAVISNGRLGSICSAASLDKWLACHSKSIAHLQIEKETEGYFPTRNQFEELSKEHDMIICLGCGTNFEFGSDWIPDTDVIIVDDQISVEHLPGVYALINSNRFDENPDLSYLGIAGMFFLLMVATNRLLRNNNRQTVDLYQFLDLIAVGTVSDHLPMIKLNRALVKIGLTSVHKRENAALTELLDTLSLKKPITSSQMAFQLGSRICAGDIIQQSQLGFDLLSTINRRKSAEIVNRLNDLYRTSKELSEEYYEKFYLKISGTGTETPLIWACHENCPLGIMENIVARINQETGKPTILMTHFDSKVIAIGQSIPGINLGIIAANCINDKLVEAGGGNAMWIMLELLPQNINHFTERVIAELYFQREIWRDTYPVFIDGLLTTRGVTISLIEKLSQLEPFGINSPKPRYGFANQYVRSRVNLGNERYKLVFEDEVGNRIDGFLPNTKRLQLKKFLMGSRKNKIHIAGTLTSFVKSGKTIPTIMVEDAATPS
ncbi:MAG: hypothetical protein OXC57_08170 [Rhodobacteraceae bacterium]|nr:hypothetical protein [Paracoccaceae bacterium]